MPRHSFAVIVSVLLASIGFSRIAMAADAPVDVEDLRPRLIATHRDAAKPTPVEVVQLEPGIALACKAGESVHPRLAPEGSNRWEGYLNVVRAGTYRFSAVLRGKVRLTIAGKEVLDAESTAEAGARVEGPEVRLEAGGNSLIAEFSRVPGSARLEVLWQAPHFSREPLPDDVLGHLPKQESAKLESTALAELGRFLAEERNCIGCHQPADNDRIAKGLVVRKGPDLSQVGQRIHAGWIERWLEAPQKLQPGAVMPQLFGEDDNGRVERYAVARYLASLGGPVPMNGKPPSPKDLEASRSRGRALFTSVGCIACHHAADDQSKDAGVRATYPLSGLGSKTTPAKLAAYLQNPLAVDPSGRMPHMLLQPREAEDLARYLCQPQSNDPPSELSAPPTTDQIVAAFQHVETRPEELAGFKRLPLDAQLRDLGQRRVIDKGCNNCHTIAPGGKPFASVLASASFDDIKKRERQESGCLATKPSQRGKAPAFGFSEREQKSLRVFLSEGTSGAGTPAPAHAARVAIKRFNCLACHSRNGEGGLTPDLVEELRKYERAENAEAVSPPVLTGVGHKLRTPWLRQVLTQAGRARPWMGLRMPQFGEAQVGQLSEALAAAEGTQPDDTIHKVPLSAAKIEAGRSLNGKNAFGCISCHDISGIPNTGTRGPDLALMNQRVRYDWYRRWLEQPQRMQPGTRMPTVFNEGKSSLDKVLGGNPDAQAEAMWAYLSIGPGLPLPEGMEIRPKGLELRVQDRPLLLRTFMPDAGARSLAVGYPGGVALAFDAATCRLAYAWSGSFLDASPVWNDRGGNPARVLGTRFWTAPPGCPWDCSSSATPPDFTARANDPAYGAPLPEGQVFQGAAQLHFEGYSTDKNGVPTFHYRVHDTDPQPLEVSERPGPLRSPIAAGLRRHFTLQAPAQQTPWLFAGETQREPRLLDSTGATVMLDLGGASAETLAAGRLLVLPQDGDRSVVLGVSAAPEGSRWHLRRLGNRWQALLRLPQAAQAGKVEVDLKLWVPYRDDPTLLKELLSAK
jgi:mono/diheme cytochrome c family protein/cytochrome c553